MTDKNFVDVAGLDDLPADSKMVVEVDGKPILLCHSIDRIFAVTNICSHAEAELDCGRMKRGWISCPVHGARFDLETGEPINPPATEPIATYEVRVTGDRIEIAI